MGWKDSIHIVNNDSGVLFVHWSLSILLKQLKWFIDGKIVAYEKQKKMEQAQ